METKPKKRVQPTKTTHYIQNFTDIINLLPIPVCDPVLGDNGELYVPKTLIPIYQKEIIPLCDICTPNQFEAEVLTGETIKNDADAWKAMEWFHNKGVQTVVLSSTNITTNGKITAFLSHKEGLYQSIFILQNRM